MGDLYLTRPEAEAHVVAGPEPTVTPSAGSDTAQAAELQGTAPAEGTSAQGQASELAPVGGPDEATATQAPPPGPPPGPGVPYDVVRGDSLSAISRRQYGHPGLWRAIYQANEDVIGRNPNGLRAGMHLTLPTDLDEIIHTCGHRGTVETAFEQRWNVKVSRKLGAVHIPVETFRRVHDQLCLLPPGDVEGTWHKLVHTNNNPGAYMSPDGEFGLGEEAAARPTGAYGQALMTLTAEAASGADTICLAATSSIGPGVSLTIGTGDIAEVVEITAVNADRTEFTITPALGHVHEAGTQVAATHNVARDVPWLEAAVRHEIGHAVNNQVGDGAIAGLTDTLGGWHKTTSFDDWAALMGNPWATRDGTVISDVEKDQIKRVISGLASRATTAGLDDGLDADHAIIKYWDAAVPVIEAAKPIARHGEKYWKHSEEYFGTNGHFFTINNYYGEFHAFNPEVQYNQVRSYATFSPAEFFAEVYTVYYEEAGTQGADPGRLLPVASWRTWMTENIHNRGHGPVQEGEGE